MDEWMIKGHGHGACIHVCMNAHMYIWMKRHSTGHDSFIHYFFAQ